MTPKDYLLYGCVVFGWSTSWLPLKAQVGIVAPEISILWRFIIAGLLCFAIAFTQKLRLRFSFLTHLYMMAMGVLMFSTNFTLFYYASFHLTSGLLAVVFSTTSMVNVLLVALLTRKRPNLQQFLASSIGLFGVALIFMPELQLSDMALPSLLLCITGTICFCLGNHVSAHLQKQGIPVISANSWGMIYGSLFLCIVSYFRAHDFIIETNVTYLGGLVWLAVFSSVLAFTCYLTLIGRIGAGRAGYATVVFPVFALLISTVFEDYIWSWPGIFGIMLVLSGNFIMTRTRSQLSIK